MPPTIHPLEAQPSAWQKSRPVSSPPARGRGRGRDYRRNGSKPGRAHHSRRSSRSPPGFPRKRGRRIEPPASTGLETPPSARQEDCTFSSPPACGRGRGGPTGATGLFRARARRFRPRGSSPPTPTSPASGGGEPSRRQSTDWKHRLPFGRRPPLVLPCRRAGGRRIFSPPACGRGRGKGLPARREQAGSRPPLPPPRQQPPHPASPASGGGEPSRRQSTDWKRNRPLGRKAAPFPPLPLAGGAGGGPTGATGVSRVAPITPAAAADPHPASPQARKENRAAGIHRLETPPPARQQGCSFSPLPLAGGVGGRAFRRDGSKPGRASAPAGAAEDPYPASPASGEEESSRPQSTNWKHRLPPGRKVAFSSLPACGRSRGKDSRRDRIMPGRARRSRRRSKTPTRLPPQAAEEERAADNPQTASAASRPAGNAAPSPPCRPAREAAPILPSRLREGSGRASRRDRIMPGRSRRCGNSPPPGLPASGKEESSRPQSTDWKHRLPPGRKAAPYSPLPLAGGVRGGTPGATESSRTAPAGAAEDPRPASPASGGGDWRVNGSMPGTATGYEACA